MKIRRKGYLLGLVLYLCVSLNLEIRAEEGVSEALFTAAVSAESEKLELYARSAVLMDGDSGRILYGKKADVQMPMASTTKIMTCIVALEQADSETVCTVSGNASAQPQVKLGMKKDDQFYLKDLLYSLMLESHNDSAVCIAETVGGSVEGFAELMNRKAEEIGCENTYYITPNGLDAEDETGIHHTTAKELALVMRYCLTASPKSEEFLEITRTASCTFSNVEGSRSYSCTNHNALLNILEGALSGKTGFTGNAGYCYVGAVEQDDKFLIVSLLACGWPNNKGYKWVDTKKLVRYGTDNFEKREVIDRNLTTESVTVENGVKTEVETKVLWENQEPLQQVSGQGIQDLGTETETVLMRKEEEVTCRIEMQKKLTAPVTENTQIGEVSFLVDGTEYAVFPVITAESVDRQDYKFWVKNLCHEFVNFVTKKLAIFG